MSLYFCLLFNQSILSLKVPESNTYDKQYFLSMQAIIPNLTANGKTSFKISEQMEKLHHDINTGISSMYLLHSY
jgi:hypothetical protein